MTELRAHTIEELTAPGSLFPLVERVVDGKTLQLYDRDPRTLRDAFLHTRDFGSEDAVVYEGERYTFAEQYDIVLRLAHQLHGRLGVGKGDRVAIAMRNYPEWIFSFWATQVLGAVAIPINAWLAGAELAGILTDCRPDVLIADEERIERMMAAGARPVTLRTVIGVRCRQILPDVIPFEELASTPPPDDSFPAAEVTAEDVSTILFTSGTTGRAKGVIGRHFNHSASLLNKLIRNYTRPLPVDADLSTLGRPPASNKLTTYPFFHIAGLNTLYSATYSGHKMVLMYKWDVQEALRIMEAEQINEMAGAPFVVQGLLDAIKVSDRDVSHLTSLGLGGSASPTQLILDIHETFEGRVDARTGYGLTETTSGVVAIAGRNWVERPGSVGTALPTAVIAAMGEDGAILAPGEVGEIVIRGPQVVTGYENLPEETAEAFRDGWFRTGDLGRIDPDGYVYIVGRLKDLVIRGGENIVSAEVELCLVNHPDVVEAAVVGMPHPSLGEEPAAIVRLRQGASAGESELRAWVSHHLAAFKVPVRIVFVDEPLPRTASGKLVKQSLAASLAPR
ncbi:AMP-binding protein [Jatrophihabitans sp.]|uniref:class I adenylate-forming enzyme family protein n=1 Tax=Jatrophihabitans sp. TaxID=1932789 RepID=UPI0030C781EB|nr:AMP-dependent synthetase and ligase [Jatrophihabitans sp.]